jgi:type III secretion protein W
MLLVSDRYPSQDKVLQTANRLGIEKWILAKISVLSQLRDSIREVSINQIYRSIQHRDDLFNAIILALEQLEDELEELLEKEEEEGEEEEEEKFDDDEEF